ncbi:MAG: protein kinase [Polyangiaceae bacterium]
MTLRVGDVFAERFRILGRAGAGGMGIVYRAEDALSGDTVALKVLHAGGKPERFLREAEVLAQITHPAVVRYVAHGITPSGVAYLAMEWLDGQSLGRRVAERRLTFAEVRDLLARVLAGLARAHGAGVVHRDLKPGNIWVGDAGLGQAKLIDFGIARRRYDPRLTERGILIGTLTYMSPEQARGESEVEPASDVFSLGSVVYKCMTGEAPFQGADPTAVLAKVLLDEPAPLAELVPEVPQSFGRLVSRMLEKSPAERPRDAAAVLDAIESMGEPTPAMAGTPGIGNSERRVVWVVLAPGRPVDEEATRTTDASSPERGASDLTLLVERERGRLDRLANGTDVASFVGTAAARDGAASAARVAEAMLSCRPRGPVAIATGLGVVGGRAPFGEAIERGAELLSRARAPRVHLDATTARLVGSELEIENDAAGLVLTGRPRQTDGIRRLLGRPTSLVGRERELETLLALYEECFDEPVARVGIVTGPAGVGKSRLRYELVGRLSRRFPELLVLIGRGDSVSRGSPFALLRQALRAHLGVRDGEASASMWQKVERAVGAPDAASLTRTRLFIAELAGVPQDLSASPELEAARQNPTVMGDSTRAAWLDFVSAECAKRPVLVVLEDLHWGDLPSVTYVDAALANSGEAPLGILCLGRPELEQAFPRAFGRREPLRLELSPLRKHAAESLVREVLGGELADARVASIVERAQGNAFFLEELIRAVAEGQEELPETVMAMVQARLDALPAEARRVLRAASAFGTQFWLEGVVALLGADGSVRAVEELARELARAELVTRRPSSALEGHAEWVFRHATVRETAYASFTPDDRVLAHRLAAQWLESVGATDALALAEHYRQGGALERAAPFYLVAAEEALGGTDLAGAIERARLGLEASTPDATRGALHYVAADAHFWCGEYEPALRQAELALTLLPPGSSRWFLAIGALANAAATLEEDALLTQWIGRASATTADSEMARASQVVCLIRGAHGHHKRGRYPEADVLIRAAEALAGELGALSRLGWAWVHHGRAGRAYYAGEVGTFIREVRAAIDDFDAIGDGRAAANGRSNLGYAALSVGDLEQAELQLRESLLVCQRLNLGGITHYVRHNLGLVLALRGKLAEGLDVERAALDDAIERKEGVLISACNMYLALILLLANDHEEAERRATRACETAKEIPFLLAQSHAVRSSVWLAQGRAGDALGEAEHAARLLAEQGGSEESEGRVYLAHVEALIAVGQQESAREIAETAAKRIRERGARLGDPELERSFLENVGEHAKLLAVAASGGA